MNKDGQGADHSVSDNRLNCVCVSHSGGPDSCDNHSLTAADGTGHSGSEIRSKCARPKNKRNGQAALEAQNRNAVASDQGNHSFAEAHMPSVALISEIREQHRQRVDLHKAEKSLTLQIKAKCRRLVGGDKKEADVLYNAMQGKKTHKLSAYALAANAPLLEARSIIEASRKTTEKRLTKLARNLPIWTWAKPVPGLAEGSVAAIVGECGDLSDYANPAKLWKRMGLAVMPDGRQRRIAGVAALEHGYSPARRSISWNIGQAVFKAQSARVDKETGEVLKGAGSYRLLYDERKAYELERVETKGHAHNRALRYMEKRLLKDFWRAWRGAFRLVPTTQGLPHASNLEGEQ